MSQSSSRSSAFVISSASHLRLPAAGRRPSWPRGPFHSTLKGYKGRQYVRDGDDPRPCFANCACGGGAHVARALYYHACP